MSVRPLKSLMELSEVWPSDSHLSIPCPSTGSSMKALSTSDSSYRKFCFVSYGGNLNFLQGIDDSALRYHRKKARTQTSVSLAGSGELLWPISPIVSREDLLNASTFSEKTLFWNENASHVSSASHILDAWDKTGGLELFLLPCLRIWAAIASSKESQLNGIWGRQPEFLGQCEVMQSISSFPDDSSRSPILMLVRLSAHSTADNGAAFCVPESPWCKQSEFQKTLQSKIQEWPWLYFTNIPST